MGKKKLSKDDYIEIKEKTSGKGFVDKEKKELKGKTLKVKKIEDTSFKEEKTTIKVPKDYKHPLIHSFLIILLITSLICFIVNLFCSFDSSFITLINNLLLILFTIVFVSVSITNNRKNKNGIMFGSILLFLYFIIGICSNTMFNTTNISTPLISPFASSNRVLDFTGKELTEVIKWSEDNKLELIQDYEYSDMIEEYHIISQSSKAGTKIKDIDKFIVAISNGPNPNKEVLVPNMVNWDHERVLSFIKENYLSNVLVEFVQSSKKENTVIEQSKSGNLKRNDEIKLTFSYGEEIGYEEVKLKDLSGMNKFEAEFYLKMHHLNYSFEEVFSNKIKKGYVVSQKTKPGTMVKINSDKIVINISKGPEIKVPNLKEMSMTEITEWVIKNKLKLEFIDDYDDSIKENNVISANYEAGKIIEVGTVIKVVISRGKLTMPKFNNYNEFREWADKYNIKYEEQHEFSNDVKAGEVIKYSYNAGDTIKNNDSIIVILSNGKEATVPNVVDSTKDQAASKLKNAGFGYTFVYSYSSSVAKGKVIKQSISAGSKVAEGVTITITISNGPKPANSGGSSGGSSSGGSSTPTPPPAPVCNPVSITIQSSLNGSSVNETSANYRRNYPNVKFNFVAKPSAVGTTGMVHPDTTQKRVLNGTTCDTFTIYIIQN